MAKQFSMPDSNRPVASASGPSPVGAMKAGGSPMVQSKASPLAADAVKVLSQGGQTLDKLPVVPVRSVEMPDGGAGNVASEDATVSKTNLIGVDGGRPGRQGAVKTQTAGKTLPAGVVTTWNPNFGPTPRKGA